MGGKHVIATIARKHGIFRLMYTQKTVAMLVLVQKLGGANVGASCVA